MAADSASALTTVEAVKAISVHNTRSLCQLLITKAPAGKRKPYGDRDSHLGTEGLVEFRSFRDPNYDLNVVRKERDVQVAEPTAEVSTQVVWVRCVNSSTQTECMMMSESEAAAVQADPSYVDFVKMASRRVDPLLFANSNMGVFSDRLAGLVAHDDALVKNFGVSQFKEQQTLRDAQFAVPITCIDWVPGRADAAAVSFAWRPDGAQARADAPKAPLELALGRWVGGPIERLFIWDFRSILHPLHVLECPSMIRAFKFCPTNEKILACGCDNGQVLLFDLGDERTQVNASLRTTYSTEDSYSKFWHPKFASMLLSANLAATKCSTQAICDLRWLPPGQKILRIGDLDVVEVTTQFMTCSLDGKLIVWDVNVDESNVHPNTELLLPGASLVSELLPVFPMNLAQAGKQGQMYPVRLFNLMKDAKRRLTGDARLLTEDGDVVGLNWVNSLDRSLAGRQNPAVQAMGNLLLHTPVGFSESPLLPNVYLAADRSEVVIAGIETSVIELLRSATRQTAVTSIAWSPTRASVFLVGRDNGEVEVWSVLDKSHDCLFTQSLGSVRVTALSFVEWRRGRQLLAAGCDDGTLMIYRVPKFLCKGPDDETAQMTDFLLKQRQFATALDEREKARAAAARQQQAAGPVEAATEERVEDDTDDAVVVDTERVALEKEYAKAAKIFEDIEAKWVADDM